MSQGDADPPDHSAEEMEVAMKAASLAVSLLAVVLMLGGLLWYLAKEGLSLWPGSFVSPLSGLLHPQRVGAPLLAMSAGLVLLGLLPLLRVVLELRIYARRRWFLDVGVALIVLLELLTSLAGLGR